MAMTSIPTIIFNVTTVETDIPGTTANAGEDLHLSAMIANVDGSVPVDVSFGVHNGTQMGYLAFAAPIPKGESITVNVMVAAGSKLRARASAVGDAQVTITGYKETAS